MNSTEELLVSIKLEQLDKNLFRGYNHDVGSGHVFGGQGLHQALDAAYQTVEKNRMAHSMHAYFILPGDLEKPIIYRVEETRDGGSFSTRRVSAVQNGKAIFIMAVSFQLEQNGFDHQIEMPDVPKPDFLQSDIELLTTFKNFIPKGFQKFIRPRPIEFRPIDPISFFKPEKQEPLRYVWMKAKGNVPKQHSIHQELLAYASDYNLLSASLLPHQHNKDAFKLQMASLDHALWFHRRVKMDEWLLYAIDSPSASNARGFTRGNIFNEDGKLVASVVQEGLIRRKG